MKRIIAVFSIIVVVLLSVIFYVYFMKSDSRNRTGQNFIKGQSFYENSDWKHASEQFEKELILNPKEAEAHLQLAIIYDDYLENENNAILHYQRYLELADGNEKSPLVQQWLDDLRENSEKDTMILSSVPDKTIPKNQLPSPVLVPEVSPLLSVKYEELKAELTQQKSIAAQLKVVLSEKEKELKKFQTQLNQISEVRKGEESKAESIKTLTEDLSSARSKIDLFNDTLSQKDRELNRIRAQSEEIPKLKKEHSEMAQKLKQSQKETSEAQAKIKQMEMMRQSLEEQLGSTSHSKFELEQALRNLKEEQNQQKDLGNKNISLALMENKELKEENEFLQERVAFLYQQVQGLSNAQENSKKEIDQLQKTLLAHYTRRSRSSSLQNAALKTERKYKVKKGESLRTIAIVFYGDRDKWRLIYQANRSKITNPNVLTPGQILDIPMEKKRS